ncbi:DHH family phosphoesterase [Cellulosilyticum lentocellum]|uniref:Phosphoesterase DHHA1 n=1 Tax=Cellulosilyticum lentocellum (strain ATCC 49066 / DSM 5427 / NCIMB 11756 / RHM5) TaxID=642492 RepID=F2JK02_CELLD|nr:hypothetical protein [Cellulosilyticum lentocellum]ADZ83284.1 hypothetical protein Clole_1559 [Cellulosilyticum lentocellum DSM 5427]
MIKHFSHNDLDGYSCVLLAQLAYGPNEVSFDNCSYEDINEKVSLYITNKDYLNYEHCYITDISITKDLAETIQSLIDTTDSDLSASHFQLIDHHLSATALEVFPWCQVRIQDEAGIKCSGTSLFFDYLKTHASSKLLLNPLTAAYVEKVRRLDTWDWQPLGDLEAKQLNDLFSILGNERFMTYWWERLQTDEGSFTFDETQQLLLEIRQNEIDKYIEARNEEIIEKTILGYKAGIVFANRFQSELGNKLGELHPELDFIAMINVGGGVSCRTVKDNVNLATDITEVFGGGGHAKAAGMPVPPSIRELVINTLFHLTEENKAK